MNCDIARNLFHLCIISSKLESHYEIHEALENSRCKRRVSAGNNTRQVKVGQNEAACYIITFPESCIVVEGVD